MDDLTHTITITISGNYPHGTKQHASVSVMGNGDLNHMYDAFRSALVAAGFSMDAVTKLGALDV